jgi:hypothetical protein
MSRTIIENAYQILKLLERPTEEFMTVEDIKRETGLLEADILDSLCYLKERGFTRDGVIASFSRDDTLSKSINTAISYEGRLEVQKRELQAEVALQIDLKQRKDKNSEHTLLEGKEEEIARLKASLRAHYEDIIHRMEQWEENPGQKEPYELSPMMEQDLGHLREFEVAWRHYSDGQEIVREYKLAKSQTRAYLEILLMDFKACSQQSGMLNDNLINTYVNEIISRIENNLPLRLNVEPHETKGALNGEIKIDNTIWEGVFYSLGSLTNDLNNIMETLPVRKKLETMNEAFKKVTKNKNNFIAALKDIVIEQSKSSNYSDPRLWEGVCYNCELLKKKLASLTEV